MNVIPEEGLAGLETEWVQQQSIEQIDFVHS
jgi:hypothetical protein